MIIDGLKQAYLSELENIRIRQSKIGCILALILMPAGASLDFLIYPDLAWSFLSLRIISDAFLGICFILLFSKWNKSLVGPVTLAWTLFIQLTISYMIYTADGANSTYYAGLNLVILAVAVVLGLSLKEAIFFCCTTIIVYILACFLNKNGIQNYSILFNNFYFLSLTSIISLVATYVNNRERFTKFRLSYELKQRNAELAELDELKSQFFANVSHELRTPLTLILAPIQRLLDEESSLPKQIRKTLDVVKNNALRLLKLVNDLLDVIRLSESNTDIEHTPVDVNQLITGMIESVSHLANQQDIALWKELQPGKLIINGDHHALEKVLLNLLSNAIKFTPANGRVIIKTQQDAKHTTIFVEDTGSGIEAKQLPHIFDRFRQADGSTTRKQQGTGLGLALVKEVVEKHHGKINVTSKVNKGTTFIIMLPNHAEDETQSQSELPNKEDQYSKMFHEADYITVQPQQSEQTTDDNIINPDKDAPLILVVDDEDDMRDYLVSSLEKEYRILQAADGERGLALAQQHHPDAIVLDMMLPGKDGLEVCKELKNNDTTQGIKIMLLTARVDETSKITALNYGADDFLTKPFSTLEVRTRLSNLLKLSALQRNLIKHNHELEETIKKLSRTENKLFQSEKLNAIGHLAAGLMHEINNPLNYSLTAIQLAKKQLKGNQSTKEILDDVYQGMDRIKNITADLRAFAHPEKIDMQQSTKLQKVIQHALSMTSYELKSVTVNNYADAVEVVGSENHLVQVFINLFTNGANAMEKAAGQRLPTIEITTTINNQRVMVHVQDNGFGIPEDKLTSIFDPFYTTNEVGEGMGLGLSICHTIVEHHGGSINVESKESEWTKFSFDLPLSEEVGHGTL